MKKLGVLFLSLLLLIGTFPKAVYAAEVPDFNQVLTQYLNEISTVRGFEVTKEMLEASMDAVGQDFSDFKNIDEVRDYFGEVIQSDYGNLKSILDTYHLTLPELQQLLADYGEELTDYVFLDELDFAVYYYSTDSAPVVTGTPSDTEASANAPVFDEATLMDFLTSIDLSDQEIQKLSDHMASMEDYFSDPLFLAKMKELQSRLEALSDINVQTMTNEQASLFADWFRDFFSLFQLQAKFSELKNGTETPLTIEDALQKGDFLTDDLKIVLSNTALSPLADIIIDHDQLKTLFSNLDLASEEFGSALHETEQMTTSSGTSSIPKTEKGGKLPKTAAAYLPGTALGLLLLITGGWLLKKAAYEKNKIQS